VCAYIRNFMALLEAIEQEQARRGDPLADCQQRGKLILHSGRVFLILYSGRVFR
jgi:hypothetical protein